MAERMSSHRHLWLAGIASFALGAVVFAPASFLALVIGSPSSGISYSSIKGTVWRGTLNDVTAGGQPLGQVHYTLVPLALLTGNLGATIDFSGPAGSGEGKIGLGLIGRKIRIENARIAYDLGWLSRYSIFGLPYQGEVRFNIKHLAVSPRRCLRADGDIWTNILDSSLKPYVGEGMALAGPAECEGQALKLVLTGQNSAGSTEVTLRVQPDLTYSLVASVNPGKAQIALDLKSIGFEEDGSELVYDAVGTLKGPGS